MPVDGDAGLFGLFLGAAANKQFRDSHPSLPDTSPCLVAENCPSIVILLKRNETALASELNAARRMCFPTAEQAWASGRGRRICKLHLSRWDVSGETLHKAPSKMGLLS